VSNELWECFYVSTTLVAAFVEAIFSLLGSIKCRPCYREIQARNLFFVLDVFIEELFKWTSFLVDFL